MFKKVLIAEDIVKNKWVGGRIPHCPLKFKSFLFGGFFYVLYFVKESVFYQSKIPLFLVGFFVYKNFLINRRF